MRYPNNKKWICLLTAICVALSFTLPAQAQTSPSWGNHDPSGTGNTLPPNQGSFVRQDPMPKSLEDITIYSSDHKGITLKVSFPDFFDYEFAENNEFKLFRRYKTRKGFRIIGNPGEPEILHRVIWLQIPEDAKNIKVDVTHQTIKGNINDDMLLCPIPEITFEEQANGILTPKENFSINQEVYQKDFFFPEYPARLIEEGYKRNVRFIKLAVPVMFYNPKTSQTQKMRDFQLKVSYESNLKNNIVSVDTKYDPFHSILNLTFPNYSYVSQSIKNKEGGIVEIRGDSLTDPFWATENNFYPNYLVIAAEIFDHPESTLKTVWADHRAYHQNGGQHTIAIAYAHEIYEAYPDPGLKEERIKRFIKMVYDNWNPFGNPSLHYLLLVGDADMYQDHHTWFLPTWRSNPDALDTGDLDYALLSGDDFESDVFLGRLPAKSEDQLTILVNKIVQFENNPPQEENHYGTRYMNLNSLFGNKHLDGPGNLERRNLLISRKKEFLEYNNVYMPAYNLFKFDSDIVTNDLNEKGSLFVGYTGHGGYSNWWPTTVNVFDLTNSQNLPAVILSAACQTAGFDQPDQDVFGENWIKHAEGGAVSFFGAMRLTAGNGHPYYFTEAVYKELTPPLLGPTIDYCKKYFDETMLLVHVLLGDPALHFGAHIGNSTKTDLSVKSTTLEPSFPTYLGQSMTVTSRIRNTSTKAAYNVPVKLFSVEKGSFNLAHPALAEWTINFLPPNGISTKTIPLTYQGESSRLFITIIDPDDTQGELSKFNNWLNYEVKYFPIYVDAQNKTGIEHGTYDKPFTNLSIAIDYAMNNDLVGDDYIHQGVGPVEVHLRKGYYGSGDVIHSKSIYLKGLEGAKKTVIFDSLDVVGVRMKIEDLTFDGRKTNYGSAIASKNGNLVFDHNIHSLLRNIFKNWNEKPALNLRREYSLEDFDYQSRWYLTNNIFFNNYETINVVDSFVKSQNNLYLTNNTFFNNQNNLTLNSVGKLYLSFQNNIFRQTGNTVMQGLLRGRSILYNNMDDETLWELTNHPEYNIQKDPKFRNPSVENFNLSVGSPSIDAGNPNIGYNDPDGTRNDQGAHGGPESIFPGIRITKPVDGSTLPLEGQGPLSLSLEWNAYKLQTTNTVRITLYHFEYEPAMPDRTNPNQSQQSGKKVIDFDFEYPNLGYLSLELDGPEFDTSYFLTISDPYVHVHDRDKINFKIMEGTVSITENR